MFSTGYPSTFAKMKNKQSNKIIFFDGMCALCNKSVKWVIKHDKHRVFKYAPLQGKTAQIKINSLAGLAFPGSIVLLDGDTIYTKSTAALRIAKELPSPLNLLSTLRFIPSPIRDGMYKLVAKHRYSWFGKYEVCTIPTMEEQGLFLE